MSGVRFSLCSGAVATGAAKKTILQVVAAANHRVHINELNVDFKGISNTAVPILIEIVTQSDAGTLDTALTPVKLVSSDSETLQVDGSADASAEPTQSALRREYYIHPQTGQTWQARFAEPLVIIGGARVAIAVTAAASVNCVVSVEGEE